MGGSLRAVACLVAFAAPANARNFGEHGGYEVVAIESTSETDRGGCVMAEDDFEGPGGTRLRLFRFLKDPTLIAVSVENYNWTSKKDEEYELKYQFDAYYYDRTARGTVDGIYHGFTVVFPYDDFSKTFAASNHLHIYRGDTVVDKLSLNGSAAGLAAFERCWNYVVADDAALARERARWKDIPKDPFSKPQ
jgi:hypothetical protein